MKFLGSRPTHEDINLVKADDPTVHNPNTDQYLDYGGANQVAVGDVKDAVAKKHEHANKTELDTYSATTQSLEYWVDGTNGSDSNDGSQEHPFATIDKAVSMIPQIVNHSVNIYVADGTYYDDVIIEGRHGTGNISIRGNFSDETAVKVSTISIYRNTCSIGCYAMEFIDDWFNAINLNCNPGSIYLYLITIAQPSSADGFYIESCPAVLLESCEISNRNRAIYLFLSTVYMMSCSGSSNTYGIYNDGGIVFTDGSPITGSYSDAEENGGQILSSRLAERDEDAVEGNIAVFDSEGNPVDSGISSSNVSDAVSKKHSQNTDTGTTSQTFQLQTGSSGVKIKNNSGKLEVRNSNDDGYANIVTQDITNNGNIYNSKASRINVQVGPDASYLYRNLANYYNSSVSTTGILKITLPVSWTSTLLAIHIIGHSTNDLWETTVSGCNHAAASTWISSKAIISGYPPFTTVRLSHDGSKCCILLGTLSTVWSYPHVVVSEVLASFASSDQFLNGWAIEIITSESGLTPIVTPTLSGPNNITISTSDPSGGFNGDVWLKYSP